MREGTGPALGVHGVQDGMWCSVPGKGGGSVGPCHPKAGGLSKGTGVVWWVLATLAVPAGSVVLSHSSRGGAGVPRLPTAVCSRRCRCLEASRGAYL